MYLAEDIVKAPQVDIDMFHHFSDKVYAKEMHIPAGSVAMSHKHSYSHLSCLAKGECIITTSIEGSEVSKEYRAPAMIEIKAGVHHQIEAVTDIAWFCIHATPEKDPDKIDKIAIGEIKN